MHHYHIPAFLDITGHKKHEDSIDIFMPFLVILSLMTVATIAGIYLYAAAL